MEKIKTGLSNFFGGLSKLIAKGYNSLHPKVKIALMVLISFVASGFTNLLIIDITEYNATLTNDYIKLIFDGLIPFLTVVYNLLQQYAVDSGTKMLAQENDPKTIAKLHTKLEETQALLH